MANEKENSKGYKVILDEGFQEVASVLADVLVEEEIHKPHQKLISKKALHERFKKEIANEITLFKTKIEAGAYNIMSALIGLSDKDSSFFSQDVANDLIRFIGIAKVISSNREEFLSQIAEEKTLQQIAHVSDETVEKMYQAAKWIYNDKQFKQAAEAFGFLTLLNPTRYAFWLGLGNAEFFNKHYEAALLAYAFCCEVNPEDPTCHLFSCRCYEQISEIDNAVNALDLALFVIADKHEHADLKSKIEVEKKRLSKKI